MSIFKIIRKPVITTMGSKQKLHTDTYTEINDGKKKI